MKNSSAFFHIFAVIVAAFAAPPQALAEIRDATILFANNKSELDALRSQLPLVPDVSGFRVIPSSQIVSLRTVKAAPVSSSGAAKLKSGGYIVVCFEAGADMNVRVAFTDVDGRWHPMIPATFFNSANVRQGVIYCADLKFQVPEEKGEGAIWIVGAVGGEPPRPIHLPGIANNGTAPDRIYEKTMWYRIE